MKEDKYEYHINQLVLKNGSKVDAGRVNVFVGANNSGKTQLLKDMLRYITGEKSERVLLDQIVDDLPDNYEDILVRYDLKIIRKNGTNVIRDISPTLDKKSDINIYGEASSVLGNALNRDKRLFRYYVGNSMVTFLNTDNRLQLAKSRNVSNIQQDGAQNVLEALYLSGAGIVEKIENIVREVFGIEVYFDTSNLGTIQYRIKRDTEKIPDRAIEAYPIVSKYAILDDQGDGLRSFMGIICSLFSLQKPIILLDEPEAFLHPPQAMKLGEIIADIIDDSKQIFIATHSADFIRGLLNKGKDVIITRLNRDKQDNTKIKTLKNKVLENIIKDPLLSSSRVLEGMFYKGVVATEADADTVFYQRLYQKIGASDEIHFVNMHNKQTLKKIIEPYQELGVQFAMIADADVIREKKELEDIVKDICDDTLKEKILNARETVYSFFQKKSKYDILKEMQEQIVLLGQRKLPTEQSEPNDIDKTIAQYRSELKKIRENSDELVDLKKKGREALVGEIQEAFDNLYEDCAGIGLFIVRVGELESWLEDYGVKRKSRKEKWIPEALKLIPSLKVDDTKEIWRFMKEIQSYFKK